VKDSDAKSTLVDEALSLLKDKERCEKLAYNMEKLAFANATETIVNEVISLIKK
jgi:UDP-N-acetylglucosamine--N-acetylmuramyl-(pentapeptide) pyrophosphoryl-undecaprenol N-acetylglucosamine transferase